jgi:hypothetical protein
MFEHARKTELIMNIPVYRFRILSNESENFVCEIECLANQSFLHFHNEIRTCLSFDNQELASFFVCGSNWEKGNEITLIDVNDDQEEILSMEKTLMSDQITDKNQKLLYVFDFFNERAIFIVLTGVVTNNSEFIYPRCILLEGEPPFQSLNSDDLIDDEILDEFRDNEEFDDEEFSNPNYDPYK